MDIRKRHIVRTLRAAVLLLFVSAFLSRCASMMTPTGGPRDSLPPVIVNMTPDNFSTNRPLVNHEKIYIEFDEFVQLKDQQKEFFTSPAMKKKPLITLRGRGIVVQLRDTLAPNTTYALNFGSAILRGAIWSLPSLITCFAVLRNPTDCRMALSLFNDGKSVNCNVSPMLYSLAVCIPATRPSSFNT